MTSAVSPALATTTSYSKRPYGSSTPSGGGLSAGTSSALHGPERRASGGDDRRRSRRAHRCRRRRPPRAATRRWLARSRGDRRRCRHHCAARRPRSWLAHRRRRRVRSAPGARALPRAPSSWSSSVRWSSWSTTRPTRRRSCPPTCRRWSRPAGSSGAVAASDFGWVSAGVDVVSVPGSSVVSAHAAANGVTLTINTMNISNARSDTRTCRS